MVWLVGHRDGLCATKANTRPDEGAINVETACNHFIVLPSGYERGKPDCPECIAVLKAAKRNTKADQ